MGHMGILLMRPGDPQDKAQNLSLFRILIRFRTTFSMESESESESEVTQSCPTLCDPVAHSLQGFSVHGIFQARVLEWVAIFFSRGFSWPRDQSQDSCIAGRCFYPWATREAPWEVLHGTSHQFITWSFCLQWWSTVVPQLSFSLHHLECWFLGLQSSSSS